MTKNTDDARSFLARLASQWHPTLPGLMSENYSPQFDALVRELKDNADRGNPISVCALAGQVLEFSLKVALEQRGADRAQLIKATLHPLIKKAQSLGVFFDPDSVIVIDDDGRRHLDTQSLDAILHRDLVQHSIVQAKEYRNQGSHGNPFVQPLDYSQAAMQLGAVIALCEILSPTLPEPSGSSDQPQHLELQELHGTSVDLSIAFLPQRSIDRVNKLVIRFNKDGDELHKKALIEALDINPAWMFARAPKATLPDLRLLIQILFGNGFHSLSSAARILLPVNDLAMSYIVRRTSKGFYEHVSLAKGADPGMFARILSRDDDYLLFIEQFIDQLDAGSLDDDNKIHKADYLAQAFRLLPARLRNRILLEMGSAGARKWLTLLRYGNHSAIVGSISDSAIGKVPGLAGVREELREEYRKQLRTFPPRHITHAHIFFIHRQGPDFRRQLYDAVLKSIETSIGDSDQQIAACRLILEIGNIVQHRGPVWSDCNRLAEIGGSRTESAALKAGFRLAKLGPHPSLSESDDLGPIVADLGSLVDKDALVTHLIATCALSSPSLSSTQRSAAEEVDASAREIIETRRKPTYPNPIETLASSISKNA